MACELMIYKSNRSFRNDSIQKGDIVRVENLPHVGWGKKEIFNSQNNFVFVKITDCNKEDFDNYLQSYKMNITYEKLGQNLNLDGHRFKIYSNKSNLNEPSLTLDKVERYFNRYNIILNEASDNSIVVDVVIFNIINNFRFFNITQTQFELLKIEEVLYNKTNGEHIIKISENSVDTLNSKAINYITSTINDKGGKILQINLSDRYIEFSINRNDILKYMQDEIKDDIESIHLVRLRKFSIKETTVDQLINYSNNNNGKSYETTKSQLIQNIVNLSI